MVELEKRVQELEHQVELLKRQVAILNGRTLAPTMVVGGPLPSAPTCGCPPNGVCGNIMCPRRSYTVCGG